MKKKTDDGAWAFVIMFIIIIVIGLGLKYSYSLDDKKIEKACNEKAETIESMRECKYFDYNNLKGKFTECLCVKDSEVKRFVLDGKEIPK